MSRTVFFHHCSGPGFMNPKGWGTWKEDLTDLEVDGYQNLLELIWVVV